jgi:hypothetical protein
MKEMPNKTPNMSLVEVTPEMAKHWLDTANLSNRRLRDADVKTMVRDMAAGHWRQTGEPLKFSNKGVLLDGQHRLTAIVDSGKTLPFFVAWDLAPEAQTAMDSGRKRTAANMLELVGEKDPGTLAAAAKLAMGVESGSLKPGSYEVTHAEVAAYIAEHPELRRACEVTRSFARRTDCGPAVVAYTYAVLAKIDVMEAYNFWSAAAENIARFPGDPALALKRFFSDHRRNHKSLSVQQRLSAIYRAWNANCRGVELRAIRTQANGKDIAIPTPRTPKN